jgi:hypothetical protein
MYNTNTGKDSKNKRVYEFQTVNDKATHTISLLGLIRFTLTG